MSGVFYGGIAGVGIIGIGSSRDVIVSGREASGDSRMERGGGRQ